MKKILFFTIIFSLYIEHKRKQMVTSNQQPATEHADSLINGEKGRTIPWYIVKAVGIRAKYYESMSSSFEFIHVSIRKL